MRDLKNILLEQMKHQDFDTMAVSIIDFSKQDYQSFAITADPFLQHSPEIFFDLASITKPLTLHLLYLLHADIFRPPWLWALEHRASLPAYKWFGKRTWREEVKSYPLIEGETLYSDLGAIRLGVELEISLGKNLIDLVRPHHHSDILHWSLLSPHVASPATGFRGGKVIRGEVHDPRAFLSREYMAHAGLFSTIDGLPQTLLNWEKSFGFIGKVQNRIKEIGAQRFALGWDRPQNPALSLAGSKFSPMCFGHTGFVGNMVWISPELQKGVVFLSNGTQKFWYAKEKLNLLRRKISDYAWTGKWSQ